MEKMAWMIVTFFLFFCPIISYSQIYYEESPDFEEGYDQAQRDYYDETEAYFPQDDEVYYSKRHPIKIKKKRQYEENGSPYATENAPIPQYIKPSYEKIIIVNPSRHAWGAYMPNGQLIRWGIATSGSSWCNDLGKPCRTKSGNFRIYSLGDEDCISSKFPLGEGGAPMPYCMFFNGGQALHGSNEVVQSNVSHGCVRLHINDARWLRYQFVEAPNAVNGYRGTRVVVIPY